MTTEESVEKTEMTSEQMRALNSEERAAMFFDRHVQEVRLRIETRQIASASVARKSPRDPSLAVDKEFIDQQTAILKGFEDAKFQATARGKAMRQRDAEKEKATVAKSAAAEREVAARQALAGAK